MYIFEPVDVFSPVIYIPVFKSSRKQTFIWKEDESVQDFAKRHFIDGFFSAWQHYSVRSKSAIGENSHDSLLDLTVYKVRCHRQDSWILVCQGDISEDRKYIHNTVLLPPNTLNIFSFYKEFILPFIKNHGENHGSHGGCTNAPFFKS